LERFKHLGAFLGVFLRLLSVFKRLGAFQGFLERFKRLGAFKHLKAFLAPRSVSSDVERLKRLGAFQAPWSVPWSVLAPIERSPLGCVQAS
jgi:hypothetical protein